MRSELIRLTSVCGDSVANPIESELESDDRGRNYKPNNNKRNGIMIKKIIKIIVLLCLCLGIPVLLVNIIVLGSTRSYILNLEQAEELEDVDCVLVLGCYVRPSGVMSGMLYDRMNKGIEVYNVANTKNMIVSGDHGRDEYDEVNTMKSYALSQGLTKDNVYMDHAGFSTYESMYRAREIFAAKRIIIVTQGYHLPRAIYNARSMGMEAYGVAAADRHYGNELRDEIREAIARVKDVGYCIFKPKPTYLGEEIIMDGQGELTDD